jgi:hypothetical protein
VRLINLFKSIRDERPWRPRRIISNLGGWVAEENRRLGWHAAQRGPIYFAQSEPRVHISRAAFQFIGSPTLKESPIGFTPERFWREPAQFTCLLRNAYLYSQDGAIRTQWNDPINELAPNWEDRLPYVMGTRRDVEFNLRPRIVVSGLSTVIAVPGCDSYYHWLLQAVPRLLNVMEHVPFLERIYIPASTSIDQIDFLVSLGVERSRLYRIEGRTRYFFHQLLVSSIPGTGGAVSGWALDVLRQLVHSHAVRSASRNIYLLRGGRRRRIKNEAEVIKICESMGFEIVDGSSLTIRKQIEVLSTAENVVGAHGAALTNVVFSQGARILEVFPPNNIVSDCYSHLSEKAGSHYFWSVSGGMLADENGDFGVDVEHFKPMLYDFLNESDRSPALQRV